MSSITAQETSGQERQGRPEEVFAAHVLLSLDCGGLERVVLDLIREGCRRGQQAAVICLERPGTLAPDVEALGVEVVSVGKPEGLRLRTIGKLATILQRLAPTVVHTHQIGALFYAGSAARRAKIPLIVQTEHGKHYGRRRRTRWLGWVAARHAQRFFCVSKDIASEALAHRIVPREKIDVVPNGIDVSRFSGCQDTRELRDSLGIPENVPVIGTIGRLHEIKRQDLLLRGFAQLRRRIPETHLLLVGDGPLRGELEQLARDLGLAASVHFAGYQSQPEQFLAMMKVFTLTSRSEGMPLVVLEAHAAGLPVVASRVGGLPEMIEHGRTGLLFSSSQEEELVEALFTLLSEPDVARGMGEAGRARVQSRFTVRHMYETYQQHYAGLLAGRASALEPARALGE